MTRKCKTCSAALPASRRRFCSDECARQGLNTRRRKRTPRRRKCECCKGLFRPTRKGHVICSAACRQAMVRDRAKNYTMDVRSAHAVRLNPFLKRWGCKLLPLSREAKLAVKREQRAADREARDNFLKTADLDPRPARKNGQAVFRHTKGN